MNAQQILNELGIARSDLSNSLKELVGWRLIRKVPVTGDRREHFAAEVDVWKMALKMAQGRKEREFDSVLSVITECFVKAKTEAGLNPIVLARMQDTQSFFGALTTGRDECSVWLNQN